MVDFEAKIGERKKPAEKGHGAVEVVIGDGVKAARAFEEGEVMGDEAEGKQEGAYAAG